MTADHMDLQASPEGCIATVVSHTTPRDAGTLSSVSRIFRSAAESDTVWDRFLHPEIHTILSSSSPAMSVHPPHVSPSSASKTKKELCLALCDNTVLIEQGKLSFSLDKWSGKKCYMMLQGPFRSFGATLLNTGNGFLSPTRGLRRWQN